MNPQDIIDEIKYKKISDEVESFLKSSGYYSTNSIENFDNTFELILMKLIAKEISPLFAGIAASILEADPFIHLSEHSTGIYLVIDLEHILTSNPSMLEKQLREIEMYFRNNF